MIATYLKERRWFRAKTREIAGASIDERFPLVLDGERVDVAIVLVSYADGGADKYVLPMATATGEDAARLAKERPHLVIEREADGRIRYDALGSERFLAAIVRLFEGGGTRASSGKGTLVFRAMAGFAPQTSVIPRITNAEQTNTSIVFGDSFILKFVRKLDPGVSAELDMGAFLTAHGFRSAPQVAGAIEIERDQGEPETVGVLHRFAPNQGDAWVWTLAEIARDPSPEAYRAHAERLGERVGEMHAVLADGKEPAFLPERLSKDGRAKLGHAVLEEARALGKWLGEGDLARIQARVDAFVALAKDPIATRIHGDLHLGQILVAGDDFILIDFEGEPARSLAERKAKRSPLADVAGMVRSFDYAAATVLRKTRPAEARAWSRATSDVFLSAYRRAAPVEDAVFGACLDFYLVEKCLYEIAYEANNRPDWVPIPRDGLHDLLA